ncbi:MAG TPA: hypothetical protein DCM71_04290 [Runella sp.]|nr:hypothetical protein [Runella sp.]
MGSFGAWSQQNPVDSIKTTYRDSIKVIARPYSDKILLRWMPLSPKLWRNSIARGYTITRQTLSGTNVVATTSFIVKFNSDSTKWHLTDSTYYQMVYDNHDEVIEIGSDTTTSVNLQYNLVAVGADMSYAAARLGGLAFVDTTVTNGVTYRYRIEPTPLNPARKSAKTATSPIVIGMDAIEVTAGSISYPTLTAPQLSRKKGVVELKWDFDSQKIYYGSYVIYRSTNGGAFERLNSQLWTKMDNSTQFVYYLDSIPNTTTTYTYRLAGKTYFDEYIPSVTSTITVTKELTQIPAIKNVRVTSQGVEVKWRFPADTVISNLTSVVSGYLIHVSSKSDSAFQLIRSVTNPSDTVALIDSVAISNKVAFRLSQYYRIGAIGVGNDTTWSLPYILIPASLDVPPAKPTNFHSARYNPSSTSNLHLVRLDWNENTDADLLGYRVYRTIGNETEKIDVFNGIRRRIFTIDTLGEDTDYPLIKYYVSAVDSNYHESELAVITYQKPDTHPPISPVITKYQVKGTDVELFWNKSSSHDVQRTEIWRKLNEVSGTWSIIKTLNATDTTRMMTDTSLMVGKTYVYTVAAFDSSGNKSCYDVPKFQSSQNVGDCYQLVIVEIVTDQKPVFTTLTATIDSVSTTPAITLHWSYGASDIEHFELYRSETPKVINGTNTTTNFTLWRTLNAVENTTQEDEPKYSYTFKYGIRAVFKDGRTSNMKQMIIVMPDKL